MVKQKKTENYQNTPIHETASEKITRLENTVTALTEEVSTIKKTMEEQLTLLRQLINENDTKTIIELAKLKATPEKEQQPNPNKNGSVDVPLPIFNGEEQGEHPKKFLRNLDKYMMHKAIPNEERMYAIENSLKGKAAKWFSMVKDAITSEQNFKTLFLKHFFSETKQWDTFIKCTEAGKNTVLKDYQEHFHKWMEELKYIDSPTMSEDQAINLVSKHFPISVQAFIQTTDKNFLSIWEKLGEIESTTRDKEKPQEKNIYYRQNQNQINNQQQFRSYNQNNNKPQQNNTFHQNTPITTNRTQGKYHVNQLSVEQEQPSEEITISDDESKNEEEGTVETDHLQL